MFPQNNCWNSLRQRYSCLSQWLLLGPMALQWIAPLPTTYYCIKGSNTTRNLSPCVSRGTGASSHVSIGGFVTIRRTRNETTVAGQGYALYSGSAQFTDGKTRATPHRSAPARSAPQRQTAIPLSFSRQQRFLTTRGRGSGRPFRQLPPILWMPISIYHRGYRKFLRFQTRDRIYQFRALPFGLSPASWVFTNIMTEIKMLVRVMGINLCQYLDGWLISSPSAQVLNICHTMGVLIHDKKLELISKQKCLFLGYQFDLVSFQVTPTLDRYHNIKAQIRSFLLSQVECAHTWQFLLGLFASTEKLLTLGRLHTHKDQHCISQDWEFVTLTSNLYLFPHRRKKISNGGNQHILF